MIVSNGDMPVNPIVMENGHPYHASQVCFENAPLVSGLTKREAFAMAVMQGMITSRYAGEYMDEINDKSFDKPSGLANNAVRYADALLKELEK